MSKAASRTAHLPAPSIEADVLIEDDRWESHPGSDGYVLDAVEVVAGARISEMPADCQVTIVLSDNERVANLNATFRKKLGATNVLSFPPGPGAVAPGARRYLGDIVLARETVVSEAQELGIPLVHHLQHLTIHGMLHLCGYDHIDEAQAEVMEMLEIRLLCLLGVPNPYVHAA